MVSLSASAVSFCSRSLPPVLIILLLFLSVASISRADSAAVEHKNKRRAQEFTRDG